VRGSLPDGRAVLQPAAGAQEGTERQIACSWHTSADAKDAGGHGEGHEAASRRGFYRHIDRAYTACLAWSMRHRWVIVVVSVVVLASTVPIYRSVKQEYIPSDVDESEFEMLVFGPEGMSLAAMDEGMQALALEARETKGVALTLASAGGGFLNRVNQG